MLPQLNIVNFRLWNVLCFSFLLFFIVPAPYGVPAPNACPPSCAAPMLVLMQTPTLFLEVS